MEFDFSQEPGKVLWNRNLNKSEKPLVSIITPYYNAGKNIQQTCNCILNQTFPFFEWIIVNDGSTNEADVEILDVIRRMDPRIRVLHKENGGISSARNYGINASVADYVLPLDGDDLIEPTFVEYCWWMLEKNPQAAWAYTDSLGFQGQEYLWDKKFDPILLKTENHLTHAALIRKKDLLEVGCYTEKYKHYNEDWYLWLKFVRAGKFPVQAGGEYLMWYRRSDTGVFSIVKNDKQIAANNKKLIDAIASEIKEPRQPVLYPQKFGYGWTSPVLSQWNNCIYRQKEKTNVLFLVPWLEMGGADKFNLDLISGLDKNKYDIGVITTIRSQNEWLQEMRKYTPDIFNMPNFMATEDYAEFVSYYIKSRKTDILFVSNSYHGYYLIPWLRQNFPDIVIVDYVHMEEWYWRRGGYARTSGAVAAVTEKTYVCNSATEKVMVNSFDRQSQSIKTVHIGVDEEYFDRNKADPGTVYKELNISAQRPVVLFICRLHPQKRPFLMIEIARKVVQSIPDVAFAVVGSGPQEKELKNKVKQLKLSENIYFLGSKKDVRPYYRDAKVTLICSIKEGLSLTAYESCSMGVPVVSADVGGQGDLIDSRVGALIPFAEDEAADFDNRTFSREEISLYADAVVRLLEDKQLWENASANCRNKIENGFRIKDMINCLDAEFDFLLSDKEAKAKRNQASLALQTVSPLAGELFLMEMQNQSAEDNSGINLSKYPLKVLIKKGIPWVLRKIKNLIKKILKRYFPFLVKIIKRVRN